MAQTFDEIVAGLEDVRERPLYRGGWRRAIVGAVITIVVVAGCCELIGLLLGTGEAVPGLNAVEGARYGWALFYTVHHAGMVLITPRMALPHGVDRVLALPSGYAVTATLAVALMGLTALAAWLLYRTGRRIGNELGGPPVHRGFHGMKVAVPYALIAWGASWPLQFELHLPGTSPFSVQPSHLASFFWPLAIAAVMGFAGGVASCGENLWTSGWWESDRWARRWRGALRGGFAMAIAALLLSLCALAALAIAQPADAATFLRGVFAAGPVAGTGVLLLSIAALPNAAVWMLFPSLGDCLQVGGGAGSSYPSYCFLGSDQSPFHAMRHLPDVAIWGLPTLGAPPAPFLALAAIPALAAVIGAVIAIRRADARGGREGLVVGAMSGVVFACCAVVLFTLATITLRIAGPLSSVASGYLRYGPYAPHGFLLALAWGAGGGAVIGWLAGTLRRRKPTD